MDKTAYHRLLIIWHRHKPWHVRNKVFYIFQMTLVVAGLAYISLVMLHSKALLLFLMLVLGLRIFYRLAKGDWFDLASQLGLKCWNCGEVFNRDPVIKEAVEKNACPACGHPVYEDSSG